MKAHKIQLIAPGHKDYANAVEAYDHMQEGIESYWKVDDYFFVQNKQEYYNGMFYCVIGNVDKETASLMEVVEFILK